MIQILILAPTLAVRAGLRALLNEDEYLEVVAEAATLGELDTLPPGIDVLVAAAEAVSRPELREFLEEVETPPAVLLLAEDPQAAQVVSGLPLRAWGLLSLDASEEELAAAVAALHEGLLAGTPELMKPNLQHTLVSGEAEELLVEELTAREVEVLELIAEGLANKQIALELEISEHTVKFHVSSIYSKLGASNRTEAVRLGARLGLIVL